MYVCMYVCMYACMYVLYTYMHVSFVLSLPLTTIKQMVSRNNERAISQSSGTVTLTIQPGFYLIKVNNRNTKALEQYMKCV